MTNNENKITEITEITEQTIMDLEQEFKQIGAVGTDDNNPMIPAEYIQDGHKLFSSKLGDIYVGVENTITYNKNIQRRILAGQYDVETNAHKVDDIDKVIKELANAGVLINPEDGHNFDMLVKEAIKRSRNQNKYAYYAINRHEVVGWKQLKDKMVYFGNNAIGLGYNSEYTGDIVKQAGTLQNWVDGVNKFIAPKVIPSIVMSSALAGVLRQRYSDIYTDSHLVIGIVGDTSTGKTTLTKVAHTTFGSAMSVMNYNTTINARNARMAERGPICGAIDDVMRMKEMENTPSKAILDIIFSLVSGQKRDRLKSSGNTNSKQEYFGTVYVSDVESILARTLGQDVGQTRRYIELCVEAGDIADSAAEIEEMVKMFNRNYGHAAEAFAEKILYVNDDYVINKFNDYVSMYASMEHMKQLSRRYALISLCADLSNKFLGTQYNLDSIRNYLEVIAKEVHQMFHGVQRSIIDPRTVSKKLRDYFIQYSSYFQFEQYPEGKVEAELAVTLGTCKMKGTELVITVPIISDIRDDNSPYILVGADPKDILEIQGGDNANLPLYPENYEDAMRSLKRMGVIKAKGVGFKKKATISKNMQIPSAVEFHLKLDNQLELAIKQSKGYVEKTTKTIKTTSSENEAA